MVECYEISRSVCPWYLPERLWRWLERKEKDRDEARAKYWMEFGAEMRRKYGKPWWLP